jgi:hypothetical protein
MLRLISHYPTFALLASTLLQYFLSAFSGKPSTARPAGISAVKKNTSLMIVSTADPFALLRCLSML